MSPDSGSVDGKELSRAASVVPHVVPRPFVPPVPPNKERGPLPIRSAAEDSASDFTSEFHTVLPMVSVPESWGTSYDAAFGPFVAVLTGAAASSERRATL